MSHVLYPSIPQGLSIVATVQTYPDRQPETQLAIPTEDRSPQSGTDPPVSFCTEYFMYIHR